MDCWQCWNVRWIWIKRGQRRVVWNDNSVRIALNDVGVETVRHCQVEKAVASAIFAHRPLERVLRRFHFVKHEALVRKSVRRKVVASQALEWEYHDVGRVEQRTIVREVTAGNRAFGVDQRLLAEAEREIFFLEKRVPVKYRLRFPVVFQGASRWYSVVCLFL